MTGSEGAALAEPGEPLSEVRSRIQSTRKTREALQSVRDGLYRQLSELELKQAELARTLGDLEVQSRSRDKRILELKTQRDKLRAAVKLQQKQLTGQLRAAHLIGREDWLKLLLNQEDPTHLARVLAYYGYLNQARTDLIAEWQHDLVRVGETEVNLAEESAQHARPLGDQQALPHLQQAHRAQGNALGTANAGRV